MSLEHTEKALEETVTFYKEQEEKCRRLRQEAEALLRQLRNQRAVDELKAEATP